jgi:hypothetical protein
LLLIGQFLNKYSPLKPHDQLNCILVGRITCKVLYEYCSFRFDPLANMATTGHSCFCLVELLKDLLIWNCSAKWTKTW